VVPLPDGAAALPNPSAPLERQIIVKEGPQKGLSLQGAGVPALLISGQAGDLPGQAELLDDDARRLAVSSGTVVDTLPEKQTVPDSTTFEQLNGSGLTAEELWPGIEIPIDQTRWGHPVSGTSVHLIGSYTPLPPSFGGEVLVSVGTETIARWLVEPSGVIDKTVTIPERLMKRVTTLEVSVRSTGDPGSCGDHLPMLLRLDGATTIAMRDAIPPVPQGFQSLPQALMPRLRIGIGEDAFGDTARAAQIIVGLRRASATPLLTEVTGLQEALAAGDPAVLIAPGGWNNNQIALPFTTDQGKLTVTGLDAKDQSVTLTLEPAAPFASLQTVFDGKRSVLIATSTGAPGLLDDLLRNLVSVPGRWSGLDGRAILSAPGADPITIPNPPIDYSGQPQANQESDQEGGWFWWAAGAVAVLAGLGAIAILLRARRT
ncbi:MAG: hypothetical protein ACR2JM_14030, partial [Mycobacterium sp.]